MVALRRTLRTDVDLWPRTIAAAGGCRTEPLSKRGRRGSAHAVSPGPEPAEGESARSEPLRTCIERAWPTMESLTRKISALTIDAVARELVAWDDLRQRLDDDNSDIESMVVCG